MDGGCEKIWQHSSINCRSLQKYFRSFWVIEERWRKSQVSDVKVWEFLAISEHGLMQLVSTSLKYSNQNSMLNCVKCSNFQFSERWRVIFKHLRFHCSLQSMKLDAENKCFDSYLVAFTARNSKLEMKRQPSKQCH